MSIPDLLYIEDMETQLVSVVNGNQVIRTRLESVHAQEMDIARSFRERYDFLGGR